MKLLGKYHGQEHSVKRAASRPRCKGCTSLEAKMETGAGQYEVMIIDQTNTPFSNYLTKDGERIECSKIKR